MFLKTALTQKARNESVACQQRCDLELEMQRTASFVCFTFLCLFSVADSKFLKTLLSFAVGGLLGDVFLHLLPEAWEYDMRDKKCEFNTFYRFNKLIRFC